MNTFFRIHILIPLNEKYIQGITAGPYITQWEANAVMMDHLELILYLNHIDPKYLDLKGTISSCVQECVLTNGKIEVLNVPTSESRPCCELVRE